MKKKLIELVIDLILFSGIPLIKAAELPSAENYIDSEFQKFISDNDLFLVCSIVFIFLLKRIITIFDKPLGIETIDEFNKIITAIFTDIIREYSHKVAEISSTQAVPSIRINIMLKTKRFFFLNRMKIYYFSSSVKKLHFQELELEYKWEKGEGACGTAWKNRRICIYDKKSETFKSPAKTLNSKVKPFSDKIGSVISIPIWSKNGEKPVFGVLSLDSNFTIDKTFFDREDIVDLLAKHIDRLSLVLDKLKVGIRL